MGKGITGDGAPPAGAAGGGGGGNWIKSTGLLHDKEFETIRFLFDHDEFFWERFHKRFEMVEVDGQRKRMFRGYKLCLNSFLGQACEMCNNDDKAGQMWLTWIYEIDHFYVQPGQGREEIERGGRKYYKLPINAVRLMRYSTAHLGTVQVRVEDLGTLLNHTFRWTRSGVQNTTRPSYLLDPLKEEPLPEEITAKIETLPDLEQVALEKIQTLDGEQKQDFGTREVDAPEEKGSEAAPEAVSVGSETSSSEEEGPPSDKEEGLENPF